jgi:type II secretory pathway component PulM
MILSSWRARPKREKKMLIILVCVIVLSSIYALVNRESSVTHSIDWREQRVTLQQVALLDQQIHALRQQGAQIKQVATPALIEKLLNQAGLYRYVSRTDLSNHRLSFEFKSIPFDDLASWLTTLTRSTTVKISHWQSQRLANPGLVTATVELTT